jgi:hypothetical protein
VSTITLSLSSAVIGDHLDRLYGDGNGGHSEINGVCFEHVDLDGATITTVKWGKTAVRVELTLPAANDLIDDCEYQAENYRDEGEPSIARPYETVAKRVKNLLP